MSGSPPPAALQAACIEALAAAHRLALGAVRGGTLVYASAGLRRLFALPEGETSRRFEEMVSAEDRERLARALASPAEAAVVFHAARADGSLFEAQLSAAPGMLPDGPATVIALFDLGERERPGRPLSYLALVDPESGLPNRLAFLGRLQAALGAARRAARPAIAMIAEVQGLEALDSGSQGEALRAVGANLRRCLRESDTVARLGPAQFGILLPRVTERGRAALPAARILAAQTEPSAATVRACIGIAAYPDDGASAELLLEGARMALAEAQRAGGGRFAFAPAARPEAAALPAYVSWSPRYEVGVQVLDGQHRELLELINRLGDALRSGRDFDQLLDALKELVRYTEHHFGTEERLMDELGARSERHRAEHRRLLDSLMRFTVQLDAQGISQGAAFLQDWLFRHIDEVDRPFAAFLRNHGVG